LLKSQFYTLKNAFTPVNNISMKKFTMGGAIIGSGLGSYIPLLWGSASMLSMSSVLFSGLGAIFGIWVGFKLGKMLE
jgi:hypothetical protein